MQFFKRLFTRFYNRFADKNILGRGYFDIPVIRARNTYLYPDSLGKLTVVGKIKLVVKCKVYALYIYVAAEYLRGLDHIEPAPVRRIHNKLPLNDLKRILDGYAEGRAAENRCVPNAFSDGIGVGKGTRPVVNGNIPRILQIRLNAAKTDC